jgi:16S rRNA (guanine527-N7)-methyltransferase
MTGLDQAWTEVLLDIWREGQRLSAVGPGPVEQHLAHATALAEGLDPPTRAVDLGSGAGIPGLALAGRWPESRWMLLDAARRRVRLLEDAIRRLGWEDRVVAVHGRAEDVARDPRWEARSDLVVARSFGSPSSTLECGVRFVAQGGLLVVSEPPEEVRGRWSGAALAELGLEEVPGEDASVRIKRFRRVGPIPASVPRRAGIPTRRPLF